jgi:hypothetical protein
LNLRDYQEEQLFILIRAAKPTQFGQQNQFTDLQRYEDFQQQVPISFYEDIQPKIELLKDGSSNLLWPGSINNFAVSAGTSGTGKHLPLSEERLQSDRRFMRKVTKSYFSQQPNIFRLWGDHISMPGMLEQKNSYEIGEISAFTARHTPWWLTPFQLIASDELIHMPFNQKIDAVVSKAVNSDVRVISAAPSWLLTIFQRILTSTNKKTIAEVWPNLSLLVCGGVKLDNYCGHLQNLIQQPVDFLETYGASEGYFAFTDDLNRHDMKLVIDNGVFYEFIPHPLPDQNSMAIQQAIPVWDVKPDIPYAMIVSTNAGLWRYALNDIVKFTQTNPPRLEVIGRVSEMLDDYGEALYAYEAEQALRKSAGDLDLDVGCFTIGSHLENEQSAPQHLWFVQTYDPVHRDTLDRLGTNIDKRLQEINRHYAIRRETDALGKPRIHSIDQQQINYWLEDHGKQKAQGKLPSILRDDEDIQFFR